MIRDYIRTHTNPPVFVISGIIAVAFVLWGVLAPSNVATVAGAVNSFITTNFGWFYILSATFFLIFVVVIMLSRFGVLRMGPPDSRPEYGKLAWFAMLFTAGMGIGLVFFAVSEPISHYLEPPTGPGGTAEAVPEAMNLTLFHWGLHPWAIYIVLGLSLGYFAFRKGLPLRPAAAFYPLIGNRIYGWIGHAVDILAVFGTLFGLGTSLGIGGQQVGAGLQTLFGIDNTAGLQVILILAITAIAVVSVLLGIDKGIRNLSLINLWLAFALMVFVFVAASSRDIVNALATNIGTYLQNLPLTSFETYPNDPAAREWQSGWTLFYWGWWISWSPFVGMFLARISYGRTIRQFIGGALFAPVGASIVWLTVFGDAALQRLRANPANPLAEASSDTAMFVLFEQLPVLGIITTIASVVAIIVVVLFFATSSDSGSLVVDILTNGGDPHPRWQQRLFWAVLEGVIAAVLLAAGAVSGTDALSALQTASIVAGLPFCVVLLLMCIGLSKGLSDERPMVARPEEPSPLVGLREATVRHSVRQRAQEDERGESSTGRQKPSDR
ncbi:BCCT family transporter [Actinopolyspora saharensis]|uniref:Choline/glycine/proline betaine transport protein n=1 Tax=Actinopolyspora saharensis TaxID=995062 RepID=A0A1H0ZIU2_9ACTN|nr:BCCT family transporter [Actinopolyspora saharensis]SDQ27026.1 choline/glycine/proline betaine transport protein [Actinopolyspora saharensis]